MHTMLAGLGNQTCVRLRQRLQHTTPSCHAIVPCINMLLCRLSEVTQCAALMSCRRLGVDLAASQAPRSCPSSRPLQAVLERVSVCLLSLEGCCCPLEGFKMWFCGEGGGGGDS